MGRTALPIVDGMDIPLAIPKCRVARFVEQHQDHLIIPVRLDAASGRCPDCGHASRSVHSRYHRHPADLPVSALQARLRIEVRRFYCLNPTCRRRTFAEVPTILLAPRARRTRRLYEPQARVGLACGGAGGARLHMPASRATVLVRAAGKGMTVADDKDAKADLGAWITQARSCDAPAIATFASGLDADLAAVRAALTEPWSSGQAEGQIDRLKLIKRQGYGRAGLDLLKRRMVLAAQSTQNEQEPQKGQSQIVSWL